MIYLHKLLPLIVSPLGLLIALMLLSIVLRRIWPIHLVLVLLLVFALPITARLIWHNLESSYPYEPVDEVEQYDAVVVLGGILRVFKSQHGYIADWNDSADRLLAGVSLIKAGKADKLIFTRGQWPWSDNPPEGELLRNKAIEMGLSDSQILLTGIAANTADEAVQVKKLIEQEGLKRIVLVTSSFHMPRSKRLFDNAGIDSKAFPVDFRADRDTINWLDFIPNADAFADTSYGIREFIGRFYYRLLVGEDRAVKQHLR